MATIYRMGKMRDLLNKIVDNKRILHVKRGTINDRNGKSLRETE